MYLAELYKLSDYEITEGRLLLIFWMFGNDAETTNNSQQPWDLLITFSQGIDNFQLKQAEICFG